MRTRVLFIVVMVLIFGTASVFAALVTYNFEGTILSKTAPSSIFTNEVGQSFSGSFTYDDSAVDLSPNPRISRYDGMVSFVVDGVDYFDEQLSHDIELFDNVNSGKDWINFVGRYPSGISNDFVVLTLFDSGGTAFNSDALQNITLNLSDFSGINHVSRTGNAGGLTSLTRVSDNSAIIPVIIVPGVMGTRLNRVSNEEEVWPQGVKMALPGPDDYLDLLKLNFNGQQFTGLEMNPSKIIEKEVFQIIYKVLIDNFLEQGYVLKTTLFTVPYDWRLDIREQVGRLADKVEQARANSPNDKINIIAHSMGGLLVKEYLANCTSTDFVDKLILIGVPQLGAPKTFKILDSGDDLGMKFFGLGLNQDKIKEISQNMLGTYQLLPSLRYVQANGGYVKDFRNGVQILDYDQTKEFMVDSGRNQLLLDDAEFFHENLDNNPFNASNVYNIIGCQNPETIVEFRIYDDDVVDITRGEGDGTVPLTSALNLSADFTKYFVLYNETSIDHLDLVVDNRTIALIDDIIQNTVTSLPQGISTLVADCFAVQPEFGNETTIAFSTHSPVELHIFDSQNNHTGPTPNGDIDLGIPLSTYERIGENSFALVPAGDTYRIVVDAISGGNFDLKVKTFNGTEIIETVTYLDVPVQSDQTIAELVFLDTQSSLTLSLDQDGNGVFETAFPPNAVLDATSSTDITPPTFVLPTIPDEVLLNTPLVFGFSATDDLSGLGVLNATVDENPVYAGSAVTIFPIGEHVFRIEAIDRAGNPRIEEIQFNAVYEFSGFLPPIKADGSGVYKIKRTLPVKFQLTDYNGTFISTGTALLLATRVNDGVAGTEEIPLSTSAVDTSNQFRYDVQESQYIFNLGLSSLGSGAWSLRVDLDDGKSYEVQISIRK